MAKITNVSSSYTIFRSANNVDYSIAPGETITVADADLIYGLVDSAIENGWLTIKDDAGADFFDNYGRPSGATVSGSDVSSLQASIDGMSAKLPEAIGPQASEKSLSVYVANQATLDNFPLVTQYRATAAGTGYSVGDILQSLEVYDAGLDPALLLSMAWSNLTTGLVLASPPARADLIAIGGTGLTDQQLRALPVDVAFVPVARTASMRTETTAGVVDAGAVSVSIANIGSDVAATVAGSELPPGYSVTWDAPKGDTLAAVSYVASVDAPLLISVIV